MESQEEKTDCTKRIFKLGIKLDASGKLHVPTAQKRRERATCLRNFRAKRKKKFIWGPHISVVVN